MNIQNITKFVSDYGLSMTISIILLYFSCKFLNILIDNFRRKTQDSFVKDPLVHNFFATLDNILYYKIPNIRISYHWKICKGRKKLFVDMLKIKLEKRKINIIESIEYIQKKRMTSDEEKEVLLKAFNKIVNDYEQAWKDEWIQDLIINKFHQRHLTKCNMIVEVINEVYNGNSFSSSREKLNAVLVSYNFLLLATVSDAEISLWELNWDLSWKIYKWLEIE